MPARRSRSVATVSGSPPAGTRVDPASLVVIAKTVKPSCRKTWFAWPEALPPLNSSGVRVRPDCCLFPRPQESALKV
jgi:hypothetical protein